METVYDGVLEVAYGQFYVESRTDVGELEETRAGQRNGLCGAAVPGHLFLTTGLHTGGVGLAVEVHDHEPPLDDTWDEIVEASFHPASASTSVVPWGDGPLCRIPLAEADHRVRYCARAMDEARERELEILEEDIIVDRYLLQFWPAPSAPDAIIKQTSRSAAYWHDVARREPPPPTPEQRAEIEQRKREKEERDARARREAMELRDWGGRLPSDRLRQVRGNVHAIRREDPALAHAIDDAGPEVQRALARWAARRAYAETGLTDVAWIAPALAALEAGRPLPPPFDEPDDTPLWNRFHTDPRIPHTLVDFPEGGRRNVLQQAMAFPALRHAADPDPLRAALDALSDAIATYGSAYPALLAEVRREFSLPG
ncbi:hypothetical protein G5C51_07380 [Streptomyces sp. A7024]|uniref:Uncharacterized protein n=1 Tax=Streptomyces coryli TaxID=1128680 RepID=A0A6G4TW34_9ACTN|nr:hypothetical protein [Streptomyces coryli]NGN63730.1 hypothetical protein [Streptomyces coryli]